MPRRTVRPGMTAMADLAAYLKLLEASGLGESVDRHMGIRRQTQGWTGSLMVTSLILLNLARGRSTIFELAVTL